MFNMIVTILISLLAQAQATEQVAYHVSGKQGFEDTFVDHLVGATVDKLFALALKVDRVPGVRVNPQTANTPRDLRPRPSAITVPPVNAAWDSNAPVRRR